MRDVLLVSKPIAPPWTDSNKNLVRDVAGALTRYRPRVMVPRGVTLPGAVAEPVYRAAGDYAPSRWTNARVLARLLVGPRASVWHFFFAPNPMTLRAGALASRVRRVPTVHTLASAPDNLEAVAPMLFADRLVVLSRHTEARLAGTGPRVTRIPPALSPPRVTPDAVARARERHGLPRTYVLYPGDLEHSDGALTFVRAAARAPGIGWVVAARPKTPAAREARENLSRHAAALGASVVWLGEIDDIHAVVAGAAVTALVANTLHAKMDYPLVLLESLALGVPVLVGAGTAAEEIVEAGGARAVAPGDDAALAHAAEALAGDPVGSRAFADSGGAWVRERCSPAAVAAAYEQVYDEVLGSRA